MITRVHSLASGEMEGKLEFNGLRHKQDKHFSMELKVAATTREAEEELCKVLTKPDTVIEKKLRTEFWAHRDAHDELFDPFFGRDRLVSQAE